MPGPYVDELRVRYGECDPQGIVFNANYMLYFDVAVTELWREALGSWNEMVERGVDCVVAETNLLFRASARFDDVLQLEVWISKLGTTSMTMRIDVARDGELLVEGSMRYVFLATESWEKIEMPDWVRAGLQPYLAER